MADAMHNVAAGPDSPAWDAAAVTPANDTDLPRFPTRGLYVGGTGGDVAVYMAGRASDTAVVFTGVPAGSTLPIRVDRVRVTSTTATGIVALY
jgi:hypothetical protein